MQTLQDIMRSVLARLSMEDDITIPTYTENRVIEAIKHKYRVIFDEYWFTEYTVEQEEYTLDGVNGTITDSLLNKVDRFSDIREVFHEWYTFPLPRLSTNINRNRLTATHLGIVPNALPDKMFTVLPKTTTGKVYITYRKRLTTFSDDTVLPIDEELLILGTCYDIMVDDATNPASAEKYKGMFETRVRQVKQSQVAMLPASGPTLDYPREWS